MSMEKLYPNNYAWAGRTALQYNVFLNKFYDNTGNIKSQYSGKLTDIGFRYKQSSASSWVEISLVKTDFVGNPNTIHAINNGGKSWVDYISYEDSPLDSQYMCTRYEPQYKYLYPCRVMISELTPNTSYTLESYYKLNTSSNKIGYNTQIISTLSGSNTLNYTYNFTSDMTEEFKESFKAEFESAIRIIDSWLTGLTKNLRIEFSNSSGHWAANAGGDVITYNTFYADLEGIRSTTVHELGHVLMSSTFNNYNSIVKFMEFATGIPKASWKWMSYHNYPVISSQSYSFIDDSLCAAAYQVTRTSGEQTGENTDEAISISGTLSSNNILSGTASVTLTLSGASAYSLENPSSVYFTDNSGAKITTGNSTLISNISGAKFTIYLRGLADGLYYLVLPAGTFNCISGSKNGPSTELKLTFNLYTEDTGEPDDFDYAFDTFAILNDKGVDTPVKDVSLNNIIFFIQTGYSGMVPDPSKEVRLAYSDNNATIRTGHLETYLSPIGIEGVLPNPIRIVLNTPITEGELRKGRYAWVIPEAAFGDLNFGKWLDNPNSIKKSKCKVCSHTVLTALVDNNTAT